MKWEGVSWLKTGLVWLVVSGMLLLLEQVGWARPLRRVLEYPLAPLRQGFVGARQEITSGFSWFSTVKTGKAKIADLERQVAKLSVEAALVSDLRAENESLRQLVGSPVRLKYEFLSAKEGDILKLYMETSKVKESMEEDLFFPTVIVVEDRK